MDRELESAGLDRPVVEGDASSALQLLEKRQADLTDWMSKNCPECPEEQRHLDAGTVASAYWHYGYLMAVRDVLALLGNTSTPRH